MRRFQKSWKGIDMETDSGIVVPSGRIVMFCGCCACCFAAKVGCA